MPLSWNEIRHNAIRFAKDWAGVTREESEKQTFWNEFFAAFGINRRAVASFEEPVKNVRDQYGFIDLFWPNRILNGDHGLRVTLDAKAKNLKVTIENSGYRKQTP